MGRMIEAIIFDLDNTLIRSAIDFDRIKSEVVAFFASKGVESNIFSPEDKIYDLTEKGIEALRSIGFSKVELSEASEQLALIMNRVELSTVENTIPIDGVHKALECLKDRGVKIGVLTRSCRAYAVRALEICGLSGYVNALVARNDLERSKPHPEPVHRLVELLGVGLRNVVLVGDHYSDLMSAKNAGIPFVGVLTGSSSARAFGKAGCRTIGSVAEIPLLLQTG